MNFRRNRDREGLMKLQDELVDETKKRCKEQGYPKFTEEQQKAYTEIGGTPFLDNQYTVFGEVEEGLDIVERFRTAKHCVAIAQRGCFYADFSHRGIRNFHNAPPDSKSGGTPNKT